ncbi:hypothetical protein SAMN05421504_102321 [Amycolatopsis xylanica]|uniref:DivIVA protein n=1 Tax=Amycolatopsis xylanica TaxID=589385 RepID=A0A1H2YZE4_9PSEU|nr:hypothetical protein [Amycolatopsis xylanica]SDX10447.1 hypothetical protein SAMN05421504_102321 [Amycolatopsis xylanica]
MVAADTSEKSAEPAHFAVAVRGYNQKQVDERLASLSAELKTTSRNRDEAVATSGELSKALSYAQKELADAKAALVRMTESPSGAGAMAERVRMMMQLAEEEIAELKASADADAASTREEADKYSHESRRAIDKLTRERAAEHEQLMADARAENQRLADEAKAYREKLDDEALERRHAADKKATDELAARIAETERAATERIKALESEAAAKLADANRQLAEAEERQRVTLALKANVADRLAATDLAVQEAIRALAPGEDIPPKPAPKTPAKPAPAPEAAKPRS